MEKIMTGIAAVTMGILGSVFLLTGLINYLVVPEPGKLIGGVFVLIGFVFVLMTFYLVKTARRHQNKMLDVIVNGRKIEAQIIEVRQNTTITVNRKHPYYVVCEAEGRIFESEYFYQDVHRFDDRKQIDVYLDENSDEVYVDLES